MSIEDKIKDREHQTKQTIIVLAAFVVGIPIWALLMRLALHIV